MQPYLEETRLGAYDFPLFQTLFNALQPGGSLKGLIDPYCFGEALSKERAITFAITHDIPNNDVFANLVMTPQCEALAYSYVLGRDGGVPLIHTDLIRVVFVMEQEAALAGQLARYADGRQNRISQPHARFADGKH